MRQCAGVLVIFLLLFSTASNSRAQRDAILPARAYLLMDGVSGQVLHHHEGYTRLPIASTTKVMTAIIALERGRLADVVTASRAAYLTGGSTIYLEQGEQQTLESLLYALMLESANDASVAIAEHLAGTEEEFARWMTAKALAVGALATNFVNSHGLHHPDHYSTAHDLAVIARYAMQNPTFRAIVATQTWEIPGYGDAPPRQLRNRNQLLGYYEGANGVKNGFTEEAELTNIASAQRGDRALIAVVLGATNQLWTSSMALLDFGFSHFDTQPVVQSDERPGAENPATPESPAEPVGPVSGSLVGSGSLAGEGVPRTGHSWLTTLGILLLLLSLATRATLSLNRLRTPFHGRETL